MQQKKDSSVGSGAQARDIVGLTWQDKYVSLQMENQKLKQQFRKICDVLSFWKWSALEAQAERDCLKEQL